MPTKQQLETALRNADSAGDNDAAQQLANALKSGNYETEPTNQQPEYEASMIERMQKSFYDRGVEFGKNLYKVGDSISESQGIAETAMNVARAPLRTAGAVIGSVADVAGEGISTGVGEIVEATPDFIKQPIKEKALDLVKSKYGQVAANALSGGVEEYGKFKEKNPDLAQDIEDVFNIASIIPITKVGQVTGKAALDATGYVSSAAKESVKEIGSFKKQNLEKQELAKVFLQDRELAKDAGYLPGVGTNKALIDETAGLKLKPKTKAEKILGFDNPKVVKNIYEKAAISQGFGRGVISSIRTGTNEFKKAGNEMVDIMERILGDAEYSLINRPSSVVGDSLLKRINVVRGVKERAGENIDKVAQSIKSKPFDSDAVIDKFKNYLSKLDVSFDDSLNPSFDESSIQGTKKLEKIFKDVAKRIKDTPPTNALKAHKLKKYLDDKINYGKLKSGLAGKSENVLRSLRKSIDDKLDEEFPRYKKVNEVYAEAIKPLKSLEEVAGKTIDLQGEGAKDALGVISRGIMSNNKSATKLRNAIKDIDKVSIKYGGKFDDDIMKQILLSDELDKVFKPAARTSLAGEMTKVADKAAMAVMSPKFSAVNAVGKGFDKMMGINEKSAFKSLRKLLK